MKQLDKQHTPMNNTKGNSYLKTLSLLFSISLGIVFYCNSSLAIKINTFQTQKQKTENSKKVAYNNQPTYQGKIKFKLAKNKRRRPATKKARKGKSPIYIIRGEAADTEPSEIDKEKFSKAGVEDITNENFPQIIESFDYPNADLLEVVRAISELTGKNFILDQNVRGKITIIAPTKITVADAYKAFLSALAANGLSVVPSGAFLKIRPVRDAQRDSIETYSGEYYPNTDQMITKIIQLKHISAEDVQKNLRLLVSKSGELNPLPSTNTVVISDFGANIHRVMKIVKQLDVAGFEEKMEVIHIKHAGAKELADLLEQIITKGQGRKSTRRGSFSSGIPRFGSKSKTKNSEVISLAVPDERTNSIIVVGNINGIARIRRLVRQLDFKLDAEQSGGVHVYYVKNGEAEKIAETINGLATAATKKTTSTTNTRGNSKAAPTPTVDPLFGGDVKIVADKATNSLIITANRQDYDTVLTLLNKIDIVRQQIYVKGVIMEMNASDSDVFGASYFKFDKDSNGLGRIGFNSGNVNQLLNPTSEGAILGFGSGEIVEVTNPAGGTFKISSLISFINFLKTNTRSNVLSAPQLMTINNEESVIEVGEDVPVSFETSTGSNGATTGSVKREPATVKLTITPFTSPDSDLVRLKVEQTIKAISSTTVQASQLAEAAIVLSNRSIKTNIIVKSKDTAVLGGLIKTEDTETIKKVPLLGDLPILGWLFRSSNKQKTKNNLMVFLTPTIMESAQDTKKLLTKTLDDRVDYIRKHFGGKDPFGKEMDELAGRNINQADQSDSLDEEDDETQDLIDETLSE